MYQQLGQFVLGRVDDFVRSDDYSFKSFGKVLSNSSDEFKLLISSMIPVDPIDPGEMALANRSYADRAYTQGLGCMMELNSMKIRDISECIRSQGLMIKKLEMNDQVLLSLVDNVIEGRSNTASSLADLGSSTLKGASSILWTLPGINVTFGIAAYAAGTMLDWYSQRSTFSKLRNDLGMTRHLILENAIPMAIHDKIDRILVNKDEEDPEGRVETVLEWLDQREKRQYHLEVASFEDELLRNDITFIGVEGISHIMGIMFPMIRGSSSIMFMGSIDLESKIVGKRYFSLNNITLQTLIHNYMSNMIGGNNRNLKIYLASRTPKMAPDDVLEDRFNQMERFIKSLKGSDEAKRSLLHAYIQSGVVV